MKKLIVTSLLGISLVVPLILQNSSVVNAKTEVYGKAPTKGAEKDGFNEADKDNKNGIKVVKKQSNEFSKTHDKNIQYDLNGNIPKDKDNIAVAKQYKKELPKLEQQLKVLKKNSKQYNSLNNKVQMHKTVIKAIFGK